MKTHSIICVVFSSLLMMSCSASKDSPPPVVEAQPQITPCPEERPQFCTRDYRPVCAQKDTGIRCVTTPCNSYEYFTAGNACTACADEKVIGYTPGECQENTQEPS
ncbi:hypothetical protein [Teredinibacter sp. KSP-S5-2]|uniref:hypothetical protein n=1 Tax=Teredinibacter sp. KSP-S5-2 TaxID=3034506 RepID=UPI00293428A3|nr:hypothetical protein [Teredinibacter sp. KSP-S5-2]WNO09065.1 hypothetical protein P5V12_19150 [Teredinibacter sp. KSP-S5-2]